MRWYEVIIILLLLPVGLYLREIAYSSITRPNRLFEDIADLWQRLRLWKHRRAEKRKHKHHNGKRYGTDRSTAQKVDG